MQVLELESRVEQLLAENRMLTEARAQAELSSSHRNASALAERDSEIESLKRMLHEANEVIERLKQTNEGLRSSTSAIAVKHREEVTRLETENARTAKELQLARDAAAQQARTVQDKDAEIAQLVAQLESTKDQIRELQQRILEQAKPSDDADFLELHDIDYFDHRCQQLCAHVQQWVLRFSKFSDMRACRLTSELSDEKLIDRLDNAVLDGTNVDTYLNDRVRRRDIFMSMTMTMIWEFVFTRYLFGMDREQRQKLKQLEKQLLEVGPPHAVRQWRAVTLTLLSRRPSFKKQRDQDTEAVVQAIMDTLAKILPPPSNLEEQITTQLRRVVREAVALAIEMRCQRAEYMMLPPLQPEYDDTGELTETVAFNAALMNEANKGQGGMTNEELEAANATVRIVLFPLVLRKGDDAGRGEDEIVVTPAQVLVANSGGGGGRHHHHHSSRPSSSGMGDSKGKGGAVRMPTPSSDAGGVSLLARSNLTAATTGTTTAAAGQQLDRSAGAGAGADPRNIQGAQSDLSMAEAGGYL
jgi:archaellum component FlaC